MTIKHLFFFILLRFRGNAVVAWILCSTPLQIIILIIIFKVVDLKLQYNFRKMETVENRRVVKTRIPTVVSVLLLSLYCAAGRRAWSFYRSASVKVSAVQQSPNRGRTTRSRYLFVIYAPHFNNNMRCTVFARLRHRGRAVGLQSTLVNHVGRHAADKPPHNIIWYIVITPIILYYHLRDVHCSWCTSRRPTRTRRPTGSTFDRVWSFVKYFRNIK